MVLDLVVEYLPVGMAVLLPLGVVFYGWRALSAASRAAEFMRLALAVGLGVALEGLRRFVGVSFFEAFGWVAGAVSWGVKQLGGVIG